MFPFVDSMEGQIIEFLILGFFCVADAYEAGHHLLEDLISRVRGYGTLSLIDPMSQIPTSTIGIHGETSVGLNIRHPRRTDDPYLVIMDAVFRRFRR